MNEMYIAILAILLLLAVFDLVVGVSNDAANFLNSAVGCNAARRSIVLAVAATGIILGASLSGGMMEIARSGVFVPAQFSFHGVMIIFLAVMLTDVILLDLFNTFEVSLLSFFPADYARSLKSISGKINLLMFVCSAIGIEVTFSKRLKSGLALLIILRISFKRINMLKTLVTAPACKVVTCSSVKAAAVYKDFIFAGLEIIEILALVIAPVKDT